jgi:ketosteroid isomerase-like protein
MSQTAQVARRYFRAWTSGDGETVAALLAPDFRFTGAGMEIEGRDAFVSAGAFPADATTTMVAEAYEGEVGFQMYDAKRGDRSVRIVEQLTVRDGLIVSSVFVTDMAAFAAFAAP